MSRIGRKPIPIPAGVKVSLSDGTVRVEGPKGKLEFRPHPLMRVRLEEGGKLLRVERPDDERQSRALHGLTRSLLANMVQGVTQGYEKRLRIEGIGYGARLEKKTLILNVGFANAIEVTPPEGIQVEVPDAVTIIVRGVDKQKVGQFAAAVRSIRKPEPYKGKGIRYENEQVRRKEGKSFTSGG
jgi:large subunit ribosomal protein L6